METEVAVLEQRVASQHLELEKHAEEVTNVNLYFIHTNPIIVSLLTV